MALSFTRFSWLWLGGKDKEQVSNGSLINSINPLGEWGLGLRGEAENLKFYSRKGGDRRVPSSSSNRKAKRKWKSREERSRRIDKSMMLCWCHRTVFVYQDQNLMTRTGPSGGWSLTPLVSMLMMMRHNFQEVEEKVEEPSVQFLSAVKKLPNDYSAGKA
ncbi:UNVERIFIED_CONTAM: hypothetical protein Slati_0031200 [Sesamum latifolium]|uniref:Uncharacterized protein n=1 Tax=Sesamum latifolium TaxID=2727402 RepID=A0AAW2Y761_9LAMI